MNVKRLVMNTYFDDVMKIISIHYGSKEEEQQRELYAKLKIIEPLPNVDDFTIYVNAFLCNEDDEEEEPTLNVVECTVTVTDWINDDAPTDGNATLQ